MLYELCPICRGEPEKHLQQKGCPVCKPLCAVETGLTQDQVDGLRKRSEMFGLIVEAVMKEKATLRKSRRGDRETIVTVSGLVRDDSGRRVNRDHMLDLKSIGVVKYDRSLVADLKEALGYA